MSIITNLAALLFGPPKPPLPLVVPPPLPKPVPAPVPLADGHAAPDPPPRREEALPASAAACAVVANSEVDTMARTLWGEARGQGVAGMTAVAAVIMNRARNPRWWGRSVEGCCLAREQFSCWNKDDPNEPKLRAVTAKDLDFAVAVAIASHAVAGDLADPTNGADSYHDCPPGREPVWARGVEPVAIIAGFKFYRLELAQAACRR